MKKPMRIFEGAAQPHAPFWGLRNADQTETGEPELEFYGYISEYSWFEDDITPAKFKKDLYQLGGGGPITVRMNSGGGDVIAASVIRSILVDYPGTVTMRIDGLAASAATYVATAGDKVLMQDTAFFMIHDPSIIAWGNEDDLKAAIDLLKTVKSGIIDAYVTKTQLTPEKLGKMMSAETWMTAKEAQEMGFVDEVIGVPAKGEPLANVAVLNALVDYVNVPEALRAAAPSAEAEDEAHPVNIAETEEERRLRDEISFLVARKL